MKEMIIYDQYNNKVHVSLPNIEIDRVLVEILDGDETGIVYFEDGRQMSFDASRTRYLSFFQGSYIVPKDMVEEWLNYEPTEKEMSHERLRVFGGDD